MPPIDATTLPTIVRGPLVRGLTKRWSSGSIGADGDGDRPAAEVTSGLPLVQRVLIARGLTDPATAQRFLEPSLKDLHNPSLIPDLDRAAERILRAAKSGERIVIYGDYDVDGISSTAILFHTLRAVAPAADVGSYVPHRLDEGYGLNVDAIRELATGSQPARVIISVDCGVTAIEPARVARELGVDLIITDHHNPPANMADLPDAFAVVHPRRPDSAYPFGELCGAGVAFKLAWRIATLSCGSDKVTDSLRSLLLELLGLTSLGVIADVVPLEGENRVIASWGLRRIKHSSIEGLQALVEASGLSGENVQAEDVGFKLAPRLNACGRMGHAREAVELLTVASGPRAIAIAEQLTRQNNERRATERRIFEQAVELAQARGMTGEGCRAIVLEHVDWHAGVVGIVCSRLVEKFHRPTILLARSDEHWHGSGRSIDGYSLHSGLSRCSQHLHTFGGHNMAAGMKIAPDRYAAFVEAFIADANASIGPDALIGSVSFDCDAMISELSLANVELLRRLAPFGRGNPEVRLRIRNARVVGRPEVFGTGSKHLSLRIGDSSGTGLLRVVGWNWAERIELTPPGAMLDILIAPEISVWKGAGRKSVEARLIDLRPV